MRRIHVALLVLTVLLVGQPRAATAAPAETAVPHLVVVQVDQAPTVDGKTEALWASTPALRIDAVAGGTRVPVNISACRTAEAWFVRCAWPDAAADRVPAKADGITLTWGDEVKGEGGLDPAPPRPGDVLAFDAGKDAAEGASRGEWANGWWTVEFRRPCVTPAGEPAPATGALSLAVGDPTRGVAVTGGVRVRAGATAVRRDFESDAAGEAPKGFRAALAGKGKPPSWLVRNETERGTNLALVQEAEDEENDRFPLALLDGVTAKDVDLSARFRAKKGFKDRAAGLVWRAKGEKDHYILRANVLEQNVVLYKMQDGLRIDLPPVGHESDYGVSLEFDPETWHVLRVVAVADRFQAYLDGRLLFDVVDTTFPGAGGVGLWTKSDSVIAFDDVLVVSLDPPAAK